MMVLFHKVSILLLLFFICWGTALSYEDVDEDIVRITTSGQEKESSKQEDDEHQTQDQNMPWPFSNHYHQQQEEERQTREDNSGHNRIVNGDIADKDAYPWFAAYDNPGCGGSLITHEFVLTAAHCVTGFRSGYVGDIRIGAYCGFYSPPGSCTDPSTTEELTFGYNGVFAHPEYGSSTGGINHDFALIKLNTQSTISPVDIDQGTFSPSFTEDKKLWAIGLGALQYNGGTPRKLQHVEISYITNDVCKYQYDQDPDFYNTVDDSMMCAADPGQDACQGDSGGPLYDAENNVLVGVVSWGKECALRQFPGVYSRISHAWPWIRETVCENHSELNLPEFCVGYTYPPTGTPTSSPTFTPCPDDEMTVQLYVITDDYGSETSWDITNVTTGIGEDVAGVDTFGYSSLTFYKHHYCIPSASCMRFEIKDSHGDGILRPYGYVLRVDDVLVATSYGRFGNFEFSESVRFGDLCTSTETPTTSPSTTPSSSPTFAPCDDDEMTVKLDIETDGYSYETSWDIIDISTGEELAGVKPTSYSDFTLYEYHYCFPSNKCLQFEMKDSFGDGIVKPDGYNFMVDDVLLATNFDDPNGDFDYSESIMFGDGCDTPTSSPSTTPTDVKACPEEKRNARFWSGGYKYKNNKKRPKMKKCKSLENANDGKIERLCSMTESYLWGKPAREVCTETCKSC